jgi:hypothetical protein
MAAHVRNLQYFVKLKKTIINELLKSPTFKFFLRVLYGCKYVGSMQIGPVIFISIFMGTVNLKMFALSISGIHYH